MRVPAPMIVGPRTVDRTISGSGFVNVGAAAMASAVVTTTFQMFGLPSRGVAGAQPLTHGHDVRLDRDLVGGQPGPDPADSSHHLVEADQEAVLLTTLGEAQPEALGGRVAGERGRADRLAEERSDRPWARRRD